MRKVFLPASVGELGRGVADGVEHLLADERLHLVGGAVDDGVSGDGLVLDVLGALVDPDLGKATGSFHADVEDALGLGCGEAHVLDLLLLLDVDEAGVGGVLVSLEGALAALPVEVGVGGLQANDVALG